MNPALGFPLLLYDLRRGVSSSRPDPSDRLCLHGWRRHPLQNFFANDMACGSQECARLSDLVTHGAGRYNIVQHDYP